MIIYSLVWGGNDGCDEPEETQDLVVKKCIAFFLFFVLSFLFRKIYLWDSITGPFSNMNPYYTPVFQGRFSSRRKQDRKKVIRLIHHMFIRPMNIKLTAYVS